MYDDVAKSASGLAYEGQVGEDKRPLERALDALDKANEALSYVISQCIGRLDVALVPDTTPMEMDTVERLTATPDARSPLVERIESMTASVERQTRRMTDVLARLAL